MTFFPTGTMSPLARAVSAEIRAEMAVQRVTGRALAAAAKFASHNYVAMRLRDEKPFTLDDVEQLCRPLGVDAAELIARAWQNHGPRLQWEANEAEALELERKAAVTEFRSRYLDAEEEKSIDRILDEVDEELARRRASDPTSGTGGFADRAAQAVREALQEERARVDIYDPEVQVAVEEFGAATRARRSEAEADEVIAAAKRFNKAVRETRPARTPEEMQQLDDMAARDEDPGA